jgi:hypothetical protein
VCSLIFSIAFLQMMHHTHLENIQILPKPLLQKYSENGPIAQIQKYSDFAILAGYKGV